MGGWLAGWLTCWLEERRTRRNSQLRKIFGIAMLEFLRQEKKLSPPVRLPCSVGHAYAFLSIHVRRFLRTRLRSYKRQQQQRRRRGRLRRGGCSGAAAGGEKPATVCDANELLGRSTLLPRQHIRKEIGKWQSRTKQEQTSQPARN